MKKYIAIMLALLLLTGNFIYADDGDLGTDLLIVGGIVGGCMLLVLLMTIPLYLLADADQAPDTPKLVQDIQENPILKHVSFAMTPEKTFVGFSFKF